MISFLQRRLAAGLVALALAAGLGSLASASPSYITAAKTQRLQVVADTIKSLTYASSTGTASAPSLVIGSSSFVNTAGTTGVTSSTTGVCAIIPLPVAGITVSGTQLSLESSAQSANPVANCTAALAAVITNGGVIAIGGMTVGTSSADVVVNTTTVATGVPFTVNSAVINHAP
ncbi:MAG: hypothetical protein INR70_02190 [Parafilimonas terrae]|nr:hypothetical protein [Parafilimonas terrae]